MPSAEQHWAFFLGLGLSRPAASFGSEPRRGNAKGDRVVTVALFCRRGAEAEALPRVSEARR
jgi:hypothetical protein